MHSSFRLFSLLALFAAMAPFLRSAAQQNLVLNGQFEDINTCTEYNSECGVEGWFYLSDVKIQMLEQDDPSLLLGSNSFGLYYTWMPAKKFYPVIGTILPCHLQPGAEYVFRGLVKKEKVNNKLNLLPALSLGPFFYVPRRPFSKDLRVDSITQLSYVRNNGFFRFEYRFVARGDEKFLTFGTFITEDTVGARSAFIGNQTINIIIDNFELVRADGEKQDCPFYAGNREQIYRFDFRHKEMDYSLYSRGDLNITLDEPVEEKEEMPPAIPKTDTLRLSDVLFDFDKAGLKPAALQALREYFPNGQQSDIDSIYIEGHTDSVGSDSHNMQLSAQRCESVRSWLVQQNIMSEARTRLRPFGKSRPVAGNQTAAGRALNRRVELVIFRKTTR